MKDIFAYRSYKKFLKDFIAQASGSGVISKLAQNAGCNRSYFSQMLNSKTQLTPDHAANLAQRMGLSAREQEFFLLLVLFERAADSGARAYFETKMAKLAKDHHTLSKRLKGELAAQNELSAEEHRNAYYSSWLYSAVHILTSVASMKNSVNIAERLQVSSERVREILFKLKEMSLVTGNEGSWSHSGTELHIEKDSNHTTQKHLNWRLRAVEQSRAENAINYSSVFTVSRKDVPKLQRLLLAFIDEQRKAISDSGSEELLCFNCDFFCP